MTDLLLFGLPTDVRALQYTNKVVTNRDPLIIHSALERSIILQIVIKNRMAALGSQLFYYYIMSRQCAYESGNALKCKILISITAAEMVLTYVTCLQSNFVFAQNAGSARNYAKFGINVQTRYNYSKVLQLVICIGQHLIWSNIGTLSIFYVMINCIIPWFVLNMYRKASARQLSDPSF